MTAKPVVPGISNGLCECIAEQNGLAGMLCMLFREIAKQFPRWHAICLITRVNGSSVVDLVQN